MKKIYLTLLTIGLGIFTSCDNFLDIVPTGEVIPETLEEYRALQLSAYLKLPDRGLTSFRSDELDLAPADETSKDSYKDIWLWNDDTQSDMTTQFEWKNFYTAIYLVNQIIENENSIIEGSSTDIKQLVGEAYLLRAYAHFLLVNFYGNAYKASTASTEKGVPIQLTTDIEKVLTRSSIEDVYQAVLNDIKEAEKRITVKSWDTGYNYRFTTVAVEALKSRVYLYMGDGFWDKSLEASQNVLKAKSDLVDLNNSNVVLPNNYSSSEMIVALEQSVNSSRVQSMFMNRALINLYGTGDLRKSKYYKAVTASIYSVAKGGSKSYACTFRTGEIYLNASEAAFHTDNLDGAKSYLLTLLKNRYNANGYTRAETEVNALTKDNFLEYLYNERFKELAVEGHRWFDLRRTTQPRIEKTYSGQTYVLTQGDARYTIRIPKEAIESNPNLAN